MGPTRVDRRLDLYVFTIYRTAYCKCMQIESAIGPYRPLLIFCLSQIASLSSPFAVYHVYSQPRLQITDETVETNRDETVSQKSKRALILKRFQVTREWRVRSKENYGRGVRLREVTSEVA